MRFIRVLAVFGTTLLGAASAQESYLLVIKSYDRTFSTTGDITATVGGKTFRGNVSTDITRLLRAGPNPLRIRWGGECAMNCTVQVAYATAKGRYRTIFDFQPGTYNPGQGDHTFTVVADGPRAAGRVSSGSADRQTLLKTNLVAGFVKVWVNGKFLGDLTGIVDRDISGYVRAGENTLRLSWDKKFGRPAPTGLVSVAYAETRDRFRPVFDLQNSGNAPRDKTYTFEVAGP